MQEGLEIQRGMQVLSKCENETKMLRLCSNVKEMRERTRGDVMALLGSGPN
jgi:hypothetical protein